MTITVTQAMVEVQELNVTSLVLAHLNVPIVM
jgi:hypothetical protein